MKLFKYTLISSLIVVSAFYFYSDRILTYYASMFIINNATKGADAIIVLGGDAKTRPSHAVKLYEDGYAKEILLTLPRQNEVELMGILKSERSEYLDVIHANELNATTIPSFKDGASSTFDEAIDLVHYLKTHDMNHVIIVTDAFHTSRAHYAFKKILDYHGVKDLKLEMSAAPNRVYDETNWYKTESGLKAYVVEPFNYLFYIFNSSNATIIKDM